MIVYAGMLEDMLGVCQGCVVGMCHRVKWIDKYRSVFAKRVYVIVTLP